MPEDTAEKPMTPEQGPPDNSEFVAPPSPPTGGEGGPASPKSTDEGGPTPAEQRDVGRAVRIARLRRAGRVAEAKRRAAKAQKEGSSQVAGVVERVVSEMSGQVSGTLNSLNENQREHIERLVSAGAAERRAIVSKITGVYTQLAGQYEERTQQLVEAFGGLAPEDEESRWVDVEYRNDFYARFQPGQEPKFYQRLKRGKASSETLPDYESRIERSNQLDARWQLARAAFIKKQQSGQADRMIENPELLSMTTGHLERLYRIPGVRQALEWYVSALVNKTPFEFQENGRPVQRNIFECENGAQFEAVRANMRRELAGRFEVLNERERRMVEAGDLEMRVADSVTWNLIWCSNLMESLDSRYGPHASGRRHGNLPGDLASDDLRMVFHPQEKYEDKISGGQVDWGVFAGWGGAHLGRIRRETSFDRSRDEVRFRGATSPREFWAWRRYGERTEGGGRIFEISAPECHPPSTCRSFLEETQVETRSGQRRSLLDFLIAGETIPWDRAPSDPWAIYLPTKLLLAVRLTDYFRGKDDKLRIPFSRDGYEYPGVVPWAESILTLFQRLGISRKVQEDERSTEGTRSQDDLVHNLKVWAVFAGTTGAREPWGVRDRVPELKSREIKRHLEWILRSPTLRFLEGRFQALWGEGLSLR